MYPKSPRTNLLANLQVILHMRIQRRIGCKKLLHRPIRGGPRVIHKISLIAWEEAIVRQETAPIAGGQHDLIPLTLLAAPVLESAVQRVIGETQGLGFFSGDVGMEAALLGWCLLRIEPNELTDSRAYPICADD